MTLFHTLMCIRSFRTVGDMVLTGSDDWRARTWFVSRGTYNVVLAYHAGPILSIEQSPSDKGIITVTDVHGRTFGVWTLLTCTLCWLCAFNLKNKPLYIATFLSFVYAFGHFLTEYLTMAASNLTTVGIFAEMHDEVEVQTITDLMNNTTMIYAME